MDTVKTKLLLKRFDYELLMKYIYERLTPFSDDYRNATQLYEELMEAEIAEEDDAIHNDVVQLNSNVTVEDQKSGKQMKFKIVLPSQANVGQGRLSIFSPLGIALMGYRKGQLVTWKMPSGAREFFIRDAFPG
ncbi:GreA/GreB family elongation factor [Pollutibacter soli]|uniref:GreA/GreB family elongation factor n=1 Tax=Pollutibacter soli TaxID=3034157 RepID=UPI0030135A8E